MCLCACQGLGTCVCVSGNLCVCACMCQGSGTCAVCVREPLCACVCQGSGTCAVCVREPLWCACVCQGSGTCAVSVCVCQVTCECVRDQEPVCVCVELFTSATTYCAKEETKLAFILSHKSKGKKKENQPSSSQYINKYLLTFH